MAQDIDELVGSLTDPAVDPGEVLIKEVRQRRRRRRLRNLAIALAVIATGVSLAVVTHGTPPRSVANSSSKSPTGTPVNYLTSSYIRQPTSLAPAPNGGLYIADVARQQILERSPNGSVSVIAGTGSAGLTGDGGPAVRADLDDPGSLAVAPDGALFFTQVGLVQFKSGPFMGLTTSVIREITPNGIIHTVAGLHPNCPAAGRYPSSMPAEAAEMYGASIFIGASGAIDIRANSCPDVTNFGPFLQLTPAGTLVKSPLDSITASAVDCGNAASGSRFTAFECESGGGHGPELLVVRQNGSTLTYPTIGQGNGGITSSRGEVVAAFNGSVVRVTSEVLKTIFSASQLLNVAPDSSLRAGTNGLALDSAGNVFLAPDFYLRHAGGCEAMIIEILKSGGTRTLWRLNSRLCY